jgi:hypothetical protein
LNKIFSATLIAAISVLIKQVSQLTTVWFFSLYLFVLKKKYDINIIASSDIKIIDGFFIIHDFIFSIDLNIGNIKLSNISFPVPAPARNGIRRSQSLRVVLQFKIPAAQSLLTLS